LARSWRARKTIRDMQTAALDARPLEFVTRMSPGARSAPRDQAAITISR
jgi:hypothetical protein